LDVSSANKNIEISLFSSPWFETVSGSSKNLL